MQRDLTIFDHGGVSSSSTNFDGSYLADRVAAAFGVAVLAPSVDEGDAPCFPLDDDTGRVLVLTRNSNEGALAWLIERGLVHGAHTLPEVTNASIVLDEVGLFYVYVRSAVQGLADGMPKDDIGVAAMGMAVDWLAYDISNGRRPIDYGDVIPGVNLTELGHGLDDMRQAGIVPHDLALDNLGADDGGRIVVRNFSRFEVTVPGLVPRAIAALASEPIRLEVAPAPRF